MVGLVMADGIKLCNNQHVSWALVLLAVAPFFFGLCCTYRLIVAKGDADCDASLLV